MDAKKQRLSKKLSGQQVERERKERAKKQRVLKSVLNRRRQRAVEKGEGRRGRLGGAQAERKEWPMYDWPKAPQRDAGPAVAEGDVEQQAEEVRPGRVPISAEGGEAVESDVQPDGAEGDEGESDTRAKRADDGEAETGARMADGAADGEGESSSAQSGEDELATEDDELERVRKEFGGEDARARARFAAFRQWEKEHPEEEWEVVASKKRKRSGDKRIKEAEAGEHERRRAEERRLQHKTKVRHERQAARAEKERLLHEEAEARRRADVERQRRKARERAERVRAQAEEIARRIEKEAGLVTTSEEEQHNDKKRRPPQRQEEERHAEGPTGSESDEYKAIPQFHSPTETDQPKIHRPSKPIDIERITALNEHKINFDSWAVKADICIRRVGVGASSREALDLVLEKINIDTALWLYYEGLDEDAEETSSWTGFRAALLKAYGSDSSLTKEQILGKLAGLRLGRDNNVVELWTQLLRLLKLAPEMSDELKRTYFIAALPEHLRDKLKEMASPPESAVDTYVTVTRWLQGKMTTGHDSQRATSGSFDRGTRMPGAGGGRFPFQRSRPSRLAGGPFKPRFSPGGAAGSGVEKMCYNCKSTEHLASACPQPKRCYKCGQAGHLSSSCLRAVQPGALPRASAGESSKGGNGGMIKARVLMHEEAGVGGDWEQDYYRQDLDEEVVVNLMRADSVVDDGKSRRERTPKQALSTAYGNVGERVVLCLFDSGSTRTCLSPRVFEELGGRAGGTARVKGAGATTAITCRRGAIDGAYLSVVGTIFALHDVLVLEVAEYDVLLGVDWFVATSATLEFLKGGRAIVFPSYRVELDSDGVGGVSASSQSHRVAAAQLQQAMEVGVHHEDTCDRGAVTALRVGPSAEVGKELDPTVTHQRIGAGSARDEPLECFLSATEVLAGGQAQIEGELPVPAWQEQEEMTEDEWIAGRDRAMRDAKGTPAQLQRLAGILEEHRATFAKKINVLTPIRTVHGAVEIITTDDIPVKGYNNNNMPPQEVNFINQQVREWEELGVIEVSSSPYNSTPLVVTKIDPSRPDAPPKQRLCIDYRRLNAKTVPVYAQLPTVEGTVRGLEGAIYFSKFDLTKGFHQLPIAPASRHKTAFRCALGNFHFTVCPFGLRNLPAIFNAVIADLLDDLFNFLKTFFDDLIVHTMTVDAHLDALEILLRRCREKHILLSIDKTLLLQEEIEVLGFTVSHKSIKIPPKALAAVQQLIPPTNVKSVQSFLGLVGYYRRFVQDFAGLAEPLTRLTKTGADFVWGAEQQAAFEMLKGKLCVEPVLRLPVHCDQPGFHPFIVYTDASNTAIAAVLSQADEEQREHPCLYVSRQLTKAERNYTVSERECLAVVFAIGKWRPYLWAHTFTVCTDHMALTYLMTANDLMGRLARWALSLQQFNMIIRHRPGKEHANADALSRLATAEGDLVLLLGSAVERFTQELTWVAEEVLPQEGDAQGKRARPRAVSRRTAESVLMVTRSKGRAEPEEAAGDEGRDAAPGKEPGTTTATQDPAAGPRAVAQWPKQLIWHKEVWLATATLAALQQGIELVQHLPARILAAVKEDMASYKATFDDTSILPLTISVKRCRDGEEWWAEVPPPSQRWGILEAAHLLGHFGVDKTVARVESGGAWWSGIEADAAALVQRCMACLRNAAHRAVYHAAQSLPIPTGVFDRVHMDLLELPPAKDGSTYMLVFVDALSKFPIAYALQTKEAESVARKLWQVIANYGTMIVIHSDNGKEFINETISALAKLHGVQQQLITAYRPQGNGLVERMNRVILAVLRKVSDKAPDMWPEWLEYVMLAIRTAVSASTGYTPFAIMYGRDFHPLENYLAVDWTKADEDDEQLVAAMARRTVQHKLVLHKEWTVKAVERARKAAGVQRASTDKALGGKVSAARLKPGTQVFLRKQVLPHKLHHRFDGPYTISRDAAVQPGTESSSALYILKDESGHELDTPYPRDFVFEVPQEAVRLTQRQSDLYSQEEVQKAIKQVSIVRPGPLPMEDTEGEMYAVERIEGVRRGKKGQEQVLVKWVGYEERQWVEESAFDADDLVGFKKQWVRARNKKAKRAALADDQE